MKKLLLLSLTAISGLTYGQSFTAANEYLIGGTQTMYQCDSAAPSFSAVTGNGVTWDYSTYVPVNNPIKTYEVVTNSNTAAFPNANKVVNVQGVLSTYLKTTNSNRSSDGFEFTNPSLGQIRANFTSGDNENIMDYDFGLNTTINDVYSGTLTGAGIINPACTGTSTSSFDAIGTLKLSPTVTRNNVQRHHLYMELNAQSIVGPVLLKIDQYEYFDFTSSTLPVLSYTNIKIYTNSTLASSLNFLLNTENTQQASIEENNSNLFSIYPNPANETITVSGVNYSGNENFVVRDLTGKTILNTTNPEINVSTLKSGVYFIELTQNGVSNTQKFVKN